MNNKILSSLLALSLLVTPLAGGAQAHTRTGDARPGTVTEGRMAGPRGDLRPDALSGAFLDRLATELKVPRTTLDAAVQRARASTGTTRPERGADGLRGVGRAQSAALLAAAARALNLSQQALEDRLRSGQTLSALATAQGVGLERVRTAVLGALEAQLRTEVTAGRLTQAQANTLLTAARQDPNLGLRGGRGDGERGGDRRGPGRGGSDPAPSRRG